ncbi:MAG: hypothetical protein JF887_06260 [Candidatus Dormibacteraeota bacterium]|uniref:Uncharacterized protein n=1 Tax=Candidatus Amunia macphersoniae TaxID=3127014 RepID=A0A934KLI2_9BACT|nr:hypothetical protein [Candidatus Dormibacteraeota bacterium]
MPVLLFMVAAVLAVVVVVAVLGFIGPFVAVVGILLALLVILNPGGLGGRLRQSPGWWGIPGMRRASAGAAPFAALLFLYAVPVPIGAFALTHAGNSVSSSPSSPPPLAGVGGGAPSTQPSDTGSVSPTGAPSVTPAPIASATPTDAATPTAVPTAAPPPTEAPITPPTARPTQPPTAPPAPPPTAPPAPPPTAPPSRNLCGAPDNPWNYNFCGGGTISSPPSNFCDYFNCIRSFADYTNGYVEECRDGMYSHSGGRPGSCSSHGGNLRPLNP